MQLLRCALCCLAFLHLFLCSVFKVQKEGSRRSVADASARHCVPSKLNNVRLSFARLQKRSDLGTLLDWFPACLLRKEVIQPHLPIRLPCYDLTPIIEPTFGCSLLAVRIQTSGLPDFHGLTGGVYKARERIHRGMLIRDY